MRTRSLKFLKRARSAAVTLEACGCLLLARGALRFLHFRQLASVIANGARQSSNIAVALQIQRHIQAAARRLPWESKCFERAIAGKIMLRRRHMNARLYLGVKKEGDAFVAHAWLEHERAEDYVALACF